MIRTVLMSAVALHVVAVSNAQDGATDQGNPAPDGACVPTESVSQPDTGIGVYAPSRSDGCSETAWRMQAVDVFGDRGPDNPGSFSAITEREIESISADHPAELLNTLPGVNIHTNSGQEHLIAIRSPVLTGGAGQGSFLILENGVPTRSPAFGNVNSLLEPHHETAQAIEVVRGPGSVKYGSNAVHGLINVILNDPGDQRFRQINASYGSLGRYKGDLIIDQGPVGRGSVSIQKDIGWRDDTDVFQLKGSGVTRTTLAGWDVTAWGSAAYLEQETADFIEGVDAYKDRDLARANDNPEAYRDAWSARGAIRLERTVANGTLTLTPFARIQEMDFRQHFLPYSGLEKNGHHAVGLMSRYAFAVSPDVDWRVGADIDLASGYLSETQDRATFGFNPANDQFPQGVHYDYTVDTLVGAVWGEGEWRISDKLTVLGGLRGETHGYDYRTDAPVGINGRFNVPADRSDEFSFVTPKLGAVLEVSDQIDFYANYARGSRAPQASDLYRLQSRQGVAEAEIETLDSFELGVRGSALTGALVFDLAAYTAEKDNFFFRDSDGLNVTDGSTRHQGIELTANWAIADRFILGGNVSWSDQTFTFNRIDQGGTEIITDGNQVDSAPEWLANLALTWVPSDRFSLQLSSNYVGEYYTNAENTDDYPGHLVTHLRAALEVSDSLETFLIIRNLTDEAYADRADFAFGNERYFPGEPLNVTFGIRKRLN